MEAPNRFDPLSARTGMKIMARSVLPAWILDDEEMLGYVGFETGGKT